MSFEDQRIQVIHYHPSSLDMNLIEPMLAHVMKYLSSNPLTTLRELQMRVHQIWNEIPKDSLERLYDGMTLNENKKIFN